MSPGWYFKLLYIPTSLACWCLFPSDTPNLVASLCFAGLWEPALGCALSRACWSLCPEELWQLSPGCPVVHALPRPSHAGGKVEVVPFKCHFAGYGQRVAILTCLDHALQSRAQVLIKASMYPECTCSFLSYCCGCGAVPTPVVLQQSCHTLALLVPWDSLVNDTSSPVVQ